MRTRFVLSLILLFAAVQGCRTTPPQSTRAPEAREQFFPEKLAEMDRVIAANISSNRLPGGVLWLERKGAAYHKAYGERAVIPKHEAMTEDTIFDAASLTKVIATTSSILLLAQEGQVQIDAPVATYIPEFAANGKERVTLRHLLTHTSGLRPDIPATPAWSSYDKGIALACAENLYTTPGSAFRYSDINFILLGEVVHRVSGKMLNEFAGERVFGPLKMRHTMFLPPAALIPRIAPTEKIGDEVLRGTVHDPTARRMGGVAG